MELHNLKPNAGSTKNKKRVGRGEGSSRGGTSTRGHKGAKSRSGFKNKRNHEGGQTPLQMRVPKRGFKSPFREEYKVLNLDDLSAYAEKYGTSKLDAAFFQSHRIIRKGQKLKILGSGSLNKAIAIEAHAASVSAADAITQAKGSLDIIK